MFPLIVQITALFRHIVALTQGAGSGGEDRLAGVKSDLGKAQRQIAEGVATQSALTSRSIENSPVGLMSDTNPGA